MPEEGEPVLLEVNTLPGMTPTSLYPDGAQAAGISFESLVAMLVEAANKRRLPDKFFAALKICRTRALSMAFERRDIKPGLIVHSDRGVEYRSQKYTDYLKANGCKPSMSRKGNCWDNAPMESFFSRLKVELTYAEQSDSVSEARFGIFEYIEVFYNRLRRHSAIGYVSPAEFERTAALAA